MEAIVLLWFTVVVLVGLGWAAWRAVSWLSRWRPTPRIPAPPPPPPVLTRAEKVTALIAEYHEALALCEVIPDATVKAGAKAAAAKTFRQKMAALMG